MIDPVSGPLTRERLKELADEPHGAATRAIRQHDPQWGRADGEPFRWKVCVERDGADTGVAYIMAASQEDADKAADDLDENEVDWDYSHGGMMVVSVEPDKK